MQPTATRDLATATEFAVSPASQRLREMIEHATHFLPTQGPISVFVHHNTLHMYEHLPFEQAVVVGGERYHCQPYLAEDRYLAELRGGRITVDDLRQVLMDDLDDSADVLVASFGTRYTLRLSMLQMNLHTLPNAELDWMLAETDLLRRFRDDVSPQLRDQIIQQTRTWILRQHAASPDVTGSQPLPAGIQTLISESKSKQLERWTDSQWESFVLKSLWAICHAGVVSADLPSDPLSPPIRLRDSLLAAIGEDTDRTIDEVLIRFCGAFLDQGFADWSLPYRELGFAKSFAKLYQHPLTTGPTWMAGLQAELKQIADDSFDPLASINDSLDRLDVAPEHAEEYITATLLALRGWAGMIWQMETTTPFLPTPIPVGTLHEYLAIRLMLERLALKHLGSRRLGTSDLGQIRILADRKFPLTAGPSREQRTYTVFQMAQARGWMPEQLAGMTQPQWRRLVEEIDAFPSVERRRILHRAYERHYRITALDAIAIHSQRRREWKRRENNPPAYVAVFCIDDREESLRRHLEEVDPQCETESAAGFFAVAMYYQGADHAHYRPLCPAIVTPKHYVREEPLFSSVEENAKRTLRRRRVGRLFHAVHASSRTIVGGWFTGIFGALATFPLVARILAPRTTWRVRQSLAAMLSPPATELHIERETAEPGPAIESLGYSLDEMSAIVVRILQDLGITTAFPPILVFFGHGSASLNNPHESAYSCGACSGGRGGPNARAFAMMANDIRVRRLCAAKGIEIPEDVHFIGAYHNTCSDGVEYYDLDLLPRPLRPLFRRIEVSINEARARAAHERSRRFESAPLDMTAQQALEHVEQRGEDLSQARPEYNHATHTMVLVGRREWSRGLFCDRRAFLNSYDPAIDDENVTILSRILGAAIPVCAGISLEYYFSTVDNEGYGCGSKLPHNVASMIGVMTGAASDLRPGLSQQMVEIHEPMRILFVIETTPEKMNRIIANSQPISLLVKGNWVQICLIDPVTSTILRYVDGNYEPYRQASSVLPEVESSQDWYRGQRGHLGFASVRENQVSQSKKIN